MTLLECLNDLRETQVTNIFPKSLRGNIINCIAKLPGIIAGSFLERNRIAKNKTQDATIYYQAEVYKQSLEILSLLLVCCRISMLEEGWNSINISLS